MPLIRTVTLNPALDEALSVARFELGGTNRCTLDSIDPGGKGVNASRVIHRLGGQTLALGIVAGVTGEVLLTQLAAEGVPCDMERVEGYTRVNVMLFESGLRRRSRLYLPGPGAGAETCARIEAKLREAAAGEIVILAGSLPPGLPAETYARLCSLLRERGARCIIDASGDALARALRAGPFLIKPNVEEAEELLGRPLRSDGAVLDATRELVRRGATYAVISLGERGAMAAGVEEAWHALPPAAYGGSAVGAGDSMTAGMALAFDRGEGLGNALRLGMAAGAATAMSFGTKLCDPGIALSLAGRIAVDRVRSEEAVAKLRP